VRHARSRPRGYVEARTHPDDARRRDRALTDTGANAAGALVAQSRSLIFDGHRGGGQ
jgi:DNA-binding MarR family transcriptional regulator